MKIQLKKTWTIERTFEYEMTDAAFKRKYKTQKNFKEQFENNQKIVVDYLAKKDFVNAFDEESDGTFEIIFTK